MVHLQRHQPIVRRNIGETRYSREVYLKCSLLTDQLPQNNRKLKLVLPPRLPQTALPPLQVQQNQVHLYYFRRIVQKYTRIRLDQCRTTDDRTAIPSHRVIQFC
jgi:hypothetical protein